MQRGHRATNRIAELPKVPKAAELLQTSLHRLLGALLIAASIANFVYAGSGEPFYFPKRGPNPTGLEVGVDPQWVDASGYRDVRIYLSTANGLPSPRDRTLKVALSPNYSGGNSERDFIVEQYVTLPQGAAAATAHVLVPQSEPWEYLYVECFEGGYLKRELSGGRSINRKGNGTQTWSEAVPAVLVIDAEADSTIVRIQKLEIYNRNRSKVAPTFNLPDTRALAALVRQRTSVNVDLEDRPADMEVLDDVVATPRLELLGPVDLPERWIGYTCFDLVIVKLDDLSALSKAAPEKFAALIDWLAAGGNMLVYGAGEDYEKINALEALCRLSPATKDGNYRASDWTAASLSKYNNAAARSYKALREYDYNWGYYEEQTAEEERPERRVEADATFGEESSKEQKFLMRPCGMGLLIAMGSADPFPATVTEWSWVFNSLDQQRTMWYRRHGISMRRENRDFWDFLIAGTGKAPVFEFVALITLFCVVIGPVNYYILNRQRRLYMLLATIPLGAGVVTFGLFSYALITDGLGTQVRLRSYTYIDQSAQRATSWSRQSYYAGLAPSRGLNFPPDAAAYTIEQHPPNQHNRNWRGQRTLAWGDEQNLRRGYMSSRVTSQLLIMHTAETTAGLIVNKLAAPTEGSNRLGGHIQVLLVRDRAGDFFWAEDVAPGAQFSLQPGEFTDRKDKLYRLILDSRPREPDGFRADSFRDPYNYYGYYYDSIDRELAAPHLGSNLMEARIRQIQNAQPQDIAPGSYIAVVDTAAEVPIGVEGAYQHPDSFHLIEGKF